MYTSWSIVQTYSIINYRYYKVSTYWNNQQCVLGLSQESLQLEWLSPQLEAVPIYMPPSDYARIAQDTHVKRKLLAY